MVRISSARSLRVVASYSYHLAKAAWSCLSSSLAGGPGAQLVKMVMAIPKMNNVDKFAMVRSLECMSVHST